MDAAIQHLKERHRIGINLILDGNTPEVVAKKMGVCRERVRQIWHQCVDMLRRLLGVKLDDLVVVETAWTRYQRCIHFDLVRQWEKEVDQPDETTVDGILRARGITA